MLKKLHINGYSAPELGKWKEFLDKLKYPSGKVTIGLTGDDKIVQFRISDQGQGIPAEDVSHLAFGVQATSQKPSATGAA